MRKPSFYNDHYYDATITADAYTNWIDAMNLDQISFALRMGAGWTGDVYLQESNDPGTTKNPNTTDLQIEPFAGSAGDRMINATNLPGRFYRLFFDHGSGSGAATVKAQGKG